METNPLVPRQRTRRVDRAAAAAEQSAPAPQTISAPQGTPLQQTIQPQPVYAQRPAQQVQSAYPAQRPQEMYAPQTPAALVQPAQPQQSVFQPLPQRTQPRTPAARPAAPAHSGTPAQSPGRTAAPRPRALNQAIRANSGWQQPEISAPEAAPRARAVQGLNRDMTREAREEAPAQDAKPVRKVPGWLTTALSLSIILVLALCAAYWLMQAYLTTQENERIAAYEAILNNYHVTEAADGTLRVTWQEHIEHYAAQYNLQPAFVTAIIRNESSFRTNAESSVGARGLMQLMPDTAEWIAGKLDDHSYHFDRMWDAETNIRYGCWYLGYLCRLFRGDAELVSAAYHAGQSEVTRWLSDPEKSSDGVNLDLDKLSDGPTKQYIGRVTQTYGIYQTLLYPDQAFGAADAVSAGGSASAAADR